MMYPQQKCRLVGCAAKDYLDLDAVSSAARRPLRHDGASLDEYLGPDEGQGKLMCPQSARSPRIAIGCPAALGMRF
jgi:hypothetical protein